MTEALSQSTLNALDRLEEVATCWQAVSDLQAPQRDRLAVLLAFLQREYQVAQAGFRQSLRSPAPRAGSTPGTLIDRAHAGHSGQ